MDEWAHRKNIERFERDLRSETEPDVRRKLEVLLALERDRLEKAIRLKRSTSGPA